MNATEATPTESQPWIDPETGIYLVGIYYGMSDHEYQRIPATRWSNLSAADESAKNAKHRLDSPKKETDALRVGRALHVLGLQPEHADRELLVDDDHATKSGNISTSAKTKNWIDENRGEGITPIVSKELDLCRRMLAEMNEHEGCLEVLAECPGREVTALWFETLPNGGRVLCKARADLIGGATLADLKSWAVVMTKFSVDAWGREVFKRLYHAQFGWYERGFRSAAVQAGVETICDFDRWTWLVLQKGGCFDVLAVDADAIMMDVGREIAEEAWQTYAEAVVADKWPGVEPGRCECSLPGYAFDWNGHDDQADGVTGIEGGTL